MFEKILEIVVLALSDEGTVGLVSKIFGGFFGLFGLGGIWVGIKAVIFGSKRRTKLHAHGYAAGVRLSHWGNTKIGKPWEWVEDKIYIAALEKVYYGIGVWLTSHRAGLNADD